MGKIKGVSLIDLMIVLPILGIAAAIIIPAVTGRHTSSSDTVSWGTNGRVSIRCISGFKMVVGSSGSVQQIIDTAGHGITCQ